MSRSEYHNLRKTDDREQWVKTICERLGVEPDYNKAIDFALAVTVSGLAVPNTACTRLLLQSRRPKLNPQPATAGNANR